jgi:hypothetical protein
VPAPPAGQLRGADATATALLAEGRRRSPTFRAIADAIEGTDLLVYVELRPGLATPGSVVFAGASGPFRVLRVRVRVPGCANALVAVLGHELQHVGELAEATEVRSEAGMARFYERHGYVDDDGGGGDGVRRYETTAARRVEREIAAQLRRPATVSANAHRATHTRQATPQQD